MERIIEKNLKKNDLDQFLNIISSLADTFSVERYYEHYLTSDEFDDIQHEFLSILERETENLLERYKNDLSFQFLLKDQLNIKSIEDASGYFDELYEQDQDMFNSITLDEYQSFIKDESVFNERVLSRNLTRSTPSTRGPIMEMLFFDIENIKYIKHQLKHLFDYPYKLYNNKYENICFYRDEEVICVICSHEHQCIIMLSQDEIKLIEDVVKIK